MKTREELENLINNSPLFSIDRMVNAELFVSEERRFLSDLTELMALLRRDFSSIGYEIIFTAKACIRAYKIENGKFLNYFNVALKKTLLTARAKDMASGQRGGLTLDEKTELTIKRILKLARMRGDDIHDTEFQKKIADILNMPLSTVCEIIKINDSVTVCSGNSIITNTNGGDTELFDFIPAGGETPEATVVNFETVREYLLSIDAAFRAQQERTKELLKKLLTTRLIATLDGVNFLSEAVQSLTFIDSGIYRGYMAHGKTPTAREIAESLGVLEASASRTLKNFIDKLKQKC